MKSLIKQIFLIIAISMIFSTVGCSNISKNNSVDVEKANSVENKNDKSNNTQETSKINNDDITSSGNDILVSNQCGLLLGFSKPIEDTDDENDSPQYSPDSYKCIWISPNASSYRIIQKDGFIIAPGKDGFYKLERTTGKFEDKDLYSEMEVNKVIMHKADDINMPQATINFNKDNGMFYSSEVFNVNFIGNDSYLVSHFQVFTSGAGGYNYVPEMEIYPLKNNLKAYMEKDRENSGVLTLKDIIPKQYQSKIDSQINSYKKQYDKTVKKESDNDKEYVSEKDLLLMRKDGIWKLFVPIKFSNWKESHNYFIDYKEIDCPLPDSLTSYNELCMPFNEIKEAIPDAIDAVSSPNKSMLVVQTSNKLMVFINPLQGIDKPVKEVSISKDEKIVLNQWCTGSYVEKWDKELSSLLK